MVNNITFHTKIQELPSKGSFRINVIFGTFYQVKLKEQLSNPNPTSTYLCQKENFEYRNFSDRFIEAE